MGRDREGREQTKLKTMNKLLVLRFLGRVLLYFTVMFFLPIGVACYYGESVLPFLVAQIVSIIAGAALLVMKPESELLRYKEGITIVGLSWLFVSLIGSIPFIFFTHPINAFFETMAGFTTTGATIFDRVEELPKSILFWRSLIQWLGGMGIIVLFVAIFPAMSKKGEKLFYAEYPGLTLGKLKPRVEDTAIALYGIYLFYTFLEIAILFALGLSPFDAICHTFTTLSTGGFSTHSDSISHFSDVRVEAVITFFMFFGGANFALHYYMLTARRNPLRDPEFRVYFAIVAIAIAILTLINLDRFDVLESLRRSAFQAVSILMRFRQSQF